jgi:HD-like signal output (HDOD) protein
MAVKVLQLVNSAFFGSARSVSSVLQAVRFLGLSSLRSLVLADALFEPLVDGDAALFEREQARSLLAAGYARRLAPDPPLCETAVTAALLHNVGRLVLIARLPEQYGAAVHAAADGTSMEESQRSRLGVTHAEISAYVLALWGLPAEVTEAVAPARHPLDDAEVLDAPAVVALAEALALEALGWSEPANAATEGEVLARLGVAETVGAMRAELALRRGGGEPPS